MAISSYYVNIISVNFQDKVKSNGYIYQWNKKNFRMYFSAAFKLVVKMGANQTFSFRNHFFFFNAKSVSPWELEYPQFQIDSASLEYDAN